MDLSNLNARDRETVEKAQQKKSDLEIVRGLKRKGHSTEAIAIKMGVSENYVLTLIERNKRFFSED